MRLFLTLAFCLAAAHVFAQWERMDGPYTGTVADLSSNDTYLFATNLSGVFRSADAGDTWEEITGSNFGPDMEPIEVSVHGPNVAVVCQRARFFRLRKLALFLSRDHGEHWTEVALPVAGDIYPSGKMVAVLPEKMLFVFGGRIWERPLDGGLWRPNPLDAASEYYARPTVMNGRVYLLGASSIMEAGLDAGQWERIEVATWNGYVERVWADGDTIFAQWRGNGSGAETFTFRTDNHGATWQDLRIVESGQLIGRVTQVVRGWGAFYGAVGGQLYFSNDGGLQWEEIPDRTIGSLIETRFGLFSSENVLYRITQQGKGLERIQKGLRGMPYLESIFSNDSVLIFGADNAGLHRFNKPTETWSDGSIFPQIEKYVKAGCEAGGRLFAGMGYESGDSCIYRTGVGDSTWSKSKLLTLDNFGNARVTQFTAHESTVFAYGPSYPWHQEQMVWRTLNAGNTWNWIFPPLHKIVWHDGQFYASRLSDYRLYISSDGVAWDTVPSTGFAQYGWMENFFPIGGSIYAWAAYSNSSNQDTLLRSDDGGVSWQKIGSGLPVNPYRGSLVGGDSLVLIRASSFLYFSTDRGENWQLLRHNLEGDDIELWTQDANHIYISDSYKAMYRLPLRNTPIHHLHGTVFHDLNANGLRDAGELPLPGITVEAVRGQFYTTTDSSGAFSMYVLAVGGASERLRFSAPATALLVPPSANPIEVQPGDGPVEIGFQTRTTGRDLGVFMAQARHLEAGKPFEVVVGCRNLAAQPGGGKYLFCRTDSRFPVNAAVPQPTFFSGDTLAWQLPALAADSVFLVKIGGIAPAGLEADSMLHFRAWLRQPGGDDNPANDVAHLSPAMQRLGNSGINWKTVDRDWLTPTEVQAGAPLTYCIGFQNIKSNNVQDPRFVEYFEPKFDPATLRILASSRPVRPDFSPDGYFNFQFGPGIVPDSSAGDASRLWVVFSIEPRRDLQAGDFVQNFSDMNFGLGSSFGNTNLVTTYIAWQSPLPAPERPQPLAGKLRVWPNPNGGAFRLDAPGFSLENARLQVFDARGRLCHEAALAGPDVRLDLPAGLYFLKITGQDGVRAGQMVVLGE
ncbi:MAG: T9SS type A sorting domain-containing protein [Saprospiraceae bacterium]